MKVEGNKSRRSQQRERLWAASLRAEDDIVMFLHKFDPAVAFATACDVEHTLAIKWEVEQEEMRRRRDPRKVMEISSTRVRQLEAALACLPQGVHPDAVAARHLLHILNGLPPDRAWWISHRVVRYQGGQFQRSQPSSTKCSRQDSEISAPTSVVRRAAARAEAYYADVRNEGAVVQR